VAIAWGGAVPSFNPALLPDPAREPQAAYLLELAAGNWVPAPGSQPGNQQQRQQQQQQQQQQQPQAHEGQGRADAGTVCGVRSSRVTTIFPADLHVYCGASAGSSSASASSDEVLAGGSAHAAATPTPSAAEVLGSFAGEPRGQCCFLCGWQCSDCAVATTALAGASLDAQLQACRASLERVQVRVPAPEQQQQQQLLDAVMAATRLFHLQQPAWYDAGEDTQHSGDDRSGSGGDSSNPATAEAAVRARQAQQQLERMQQQLQPLRDVVALREVYLQQHSSRPVWPHAAFAELAADALDDVQQQMRSERLQRKRLQERLRLATRPGAAAGGAGAVAGMAAAAAAAAAGDAQAAADDSAVAEHPARGHVGNT
jgi:hypothetical protein